MAIILYTCLGRALGCTEKVSTAHTSIFFGGPSIWHGETIYGAVDGPGGPILGEPSMA